jgi:predicted DNA-binding transcriptional regulator YafY
MANQHETLLRQWQMLRHIPRYPYKISARTLKDKLDVDGYIVSKRTVERDLLQLSLSFPLFQDDRDKQYGWSWQKDAPSFDLPGITSSEALAMLMLKQHLAGILPSSTLGVLKPHFIAAQKQLESNLKSSTVKSWLNKVRTIQPNQTLIPPEVIPEVQETITNALLLDNQVQIKYKNREGDIKDYRVHLLGLVQRGGMIYLNVRIADFNDLRLLAIHRIQAAEMLDDKTIYPSNYSIDEEVNKGSFDFGSGNKINLKARFSYKTGNHLFDTPLSADQLINVLDNEQIEVVASIADTPQLTWWLLAFGAEVEVIEPKELRLKIAEILNQAANLYQK